MRGAPTRARADAADDPCRGPCANAARAIGGEEHKERDSMRVLLVEDNAAVCEQVRRTIHAIPGAQVVHVAASEPQATAWLLAHPDGWDLALIDLFLAQGHGFDVLRRCRERQPHQQAVVLSNYTRDPVRECAREAGADAVFDKSFEMDALVEYMVAFSSTCRDGAATMLS
jgi:DNA-binding NarL/FixJ family response regulator